MYTHELGPDFTDALTHYAHTYADFDDLPVSDQDQIFTTITISEIFSCFTADEWADECSEDMSIFEWAMCMARKVGYSDYYLNLIRDKFEEERLDYIRFLIDNALDTRIEESPFNNVFDPAWEAGY